MRHSASKTRVNIFKGNMDDKIDHAAAAMKRPNVVARTTRIFMPRNSYLFEKRSQNCCVYSTEIVLRLP
jgi:hypothetical protein